MGCSAFLFFDRERAVLRWAEEQPQELRLEEIGESYGRYRLHIPELERGMMRSLESYGQLAPIVVVRQEGHWELIDGFKRLAPRGSCRRWIDSWLGRWKPMNTAQRQR